MVGWLRAATRTIVEEDMGVSIADGEQASGCNAIVVVWVVVLDRWWWGGTLSRSRLAASAVVVCLRFRQATALGAA